MSFWDTTTESTPQKESFWGPSTTSKAPAPVVKTTTPSSVPSKLKDVASIVASKAIPGSSIALKPVDKFKNLLGIKDNSKAGLVFNTITGFNQAAAGIGKDILQTIARSAGTVGVSAGNAVAKLAGAPAPFADETPTDQSKFTEAVFGGKPIRTLGSASKNAADEANKFASAISGKEVKPVGKLGGAGFAVGGILMDLSGFGGKAGVKAFTDEIPKAFLEYAAKEKSPALLDDALKKIGLDEIRSKALSSELAPTKNIDEVKQVLTSFGDGSKHTPAVIAKLEENKAIAKDLITEAKQTLQAHPGKSLQRLSSRKEGQFIDPLNPALAKTASEAKAIIERTQKQFDRAESALEDTVFHDQFDNPDVIRQQIDEYNQLKQTLADYKDQSKQISLDLKTEKADVKPHLKFDDTGKKLAYNPREQAIVDAQKPLPPSSPIDTTTGEGRSIEIQARQALEATKEGGNVAPNVSLPKIIQKTITPVKQKVHLIDTYLTTPHFVMEKIGLGKESKMLRNATDNYWKELPKNLDVITDWMKRVPSKEQNLRIFKYLDGEAIDLTPTELEVAGEIRAYLQKWAKRLGLPEDRQISHYITHIFDKELGAKEFDEDLAKIITDRIPGQVYDPFLEKRLGVKGYIQDTWRALDAYVKRATRKVHMDPALETIKEKTGSTLATSKIEKSQFQYVQRYIDNINMRPGDFDEGFDNLLKYMIGNKLGPRPSLAVLGGLRRWTFRAMLGLNPASALRNLSQGINTFAVLGPMKTFTGYMKLFSKGAIDELAREGVLNTGFVQDRVLSSFKKKIEAFDDGLFIFFDKAEKINRGSAYFGAKSKALAEGKSEQEAIEYGKEVVRQTQFQFDTVDTPVGMSSNIAKTLTQFQTFTTKQIEFLVQLGKDKNYAGLIRYTLGGLLFVYTIGKAFGMKPEELIPSWRFDTPPSVKFPVEVGKAFANTPNKYNQPRDLKQKLIDVAKTGLGIIPGGSQMKKTFEGIKAVKESGSFDKSGRLQYPVDDTLGAKIQAIAFGKYASQNAQDYFNKADINAKEEAKLQPIYDKVQELKNAGDETQAQAIVDDLSDADYETYKSVRTKAITAATLQGKKDILPIYQEVQQHVADGEEDKAMEIIDNMTDDQYKYYGLVKKQVENDKKAAGGDKPEFGDGEPQTTKGVLNTVLTYAKAIGVDPLTAFNRIFTGQKIRYVTNGTVVVERMSLKDSQDVKDARGGNSIDLKLDHTIPLELGGSNAEDNLVLVPTEVWKSYTPVENALGKAIRNGKISKTKAQDLIRSFKEGSITSDYVLQQL